MYGTELTVLKNKGRRVQLDFSTLTIREEKSMNKSLN